MEKGGINSHTKPTATEQTADSNRTANSSDKKNITVFMISTEIAKPIVGSIS